MSELVEENSLLKRRQGSNDVGVRLSMVLTDLLPLSEPKKRAAPIMSTALTFDIGKVNLRSGISCVHELGGGTGVVPGTVCLPALSWQHNLYAVLFSFALDIQDRLLVARSSRQVHLKIVVLQSITDTRITLLIACKMSCHLRTDWLIIEYHQRCRDICIKERLVFSPSIH